MRLRGLTVTDWRNAARTEVDADARLVVLHGENAQGKTNLLEAVWLLATLRSFREGRASRLIREGAAEARVVGALLGEDGPRRLEWRRQPDHRELRIDGQLIHQLGPWFAQLRAVLFCPEHTQIVRGDPEARRAFLDRAAFTARPAHLELVTDYGRVLKQKAALLRERRADLDQLATWDAELVRLGAKLAVRRQQVLDELEGPFAEAHGAIVGAGPAPRLELRGVGAAARDEAEVAGRFAELLARAAPDERRRAQPLCGPHRDDLLMHLEGRDARRFASQGQARALVLALKLAEVEAARRRGQRPLFLLDDLTSELDRGRMERLVRRLDTLPGQVWITTTDPAWLGPLPGEDTALVRVSGGVATRGPAPSGPAVGARVDHPTSV